MQLTEAALRWWNELSTQGILITDDQLNIQGWNSWLAIQSGLTSDEVIGRNLLQVYPDIITRRLDEYYRDALDRQVRIISQRLHGYLLAMPPSIEGASFSHMQQSARIAPLIEGEQVIGTITVIDDVTERVEREDHLVALLSNEKTARTEAEAANRAKDEFLAIVSHELRTPLNAILGWAQILRTTQADRDASKRGLEIIENNAKAQAKLIEDVLDASRIITGKLRLDIRPVDLGAIIESAVEAARPAAAAKSIQLNVLLEPWGGLVSGDPNRLRQIIWNLVFNAIKFTGKLGLVEVRLQRIDSQAQVTVKDTGQGISADFLPHVFDRFRQADSSRARKHGGLGLGLAIVRHLVELHGGIVYAESEGEGQGAAFTVNLPVIMVDSREDISNRDAQAGGAAVSRGGTEASLQDVRVLVVDNESDAREILNISLTQCGARVATARSTREALEVIGEWEPDVLVSDIGMPGEDGYALIKKVRSLDPERGGNIPAVAVTGYAGTEERMRLLSAGYQAHVTKPVEIDELIVAIAELAKSGPKRVNA